MRSKPACLDRAAQLLRRLCAPCLVWSDARRIAALLATVGALLVCQRLSLTRLGRALTGPRRAKHGIKRVDRLLGNQHLWAEQTVVYAALAAKLLGTLRRPILLVDWTKVMGGLHALVAAVPLDGRALPIYVEVHREKYLGNDRVQRRFLHALAHLLPPGCAPILVLDAGFGTPFWQAIRAQGWDFVARVRGVRKVRAQAGGTWIRATSLYAQATAQPTALGTWLACRQRPAGPFRLVQVTSPRHRGRRHRLRPHSKAQKSARAAAKEPWLLATSLFALSAQEIVALYRRRMRIEELFRDAKNHRFGWSLREARTTCPERAAILFLIAALALVVVTLLGLAAEAAGVHRAYQANTVTHRRVLSHFLLGNLLLQRPEEPWLDEVSLAHAFDQLIALLQRVAQPEHPP